MRPIFGQNFRSKLCNSIFPHIRDAAVPVGTGCEALLVSDKLIGGIGTSRVKYSVGLDTTQSGLVPSVETDI
jgi:hypothetical protein